MIGGGCWYWPGGTGEWEHKILSCEGNIGPQAKNCAAKNITTFLKRKAHTPLLPPAPEVLLSPVHVWNAWITALTAGLWRTRVGSLQGPRRVTGVLCWSWVCWAVFCGIVTDVQLQQPISFLKEGFVPQVTGTSKITWSYAKWIEQTYVWLFQWNKILDIRGNDFR